VLLDVGRLGREPDREGTTFERRNRGEDVRRLREMQIERITGLFDLLGRATARRVVGDRRGTDVDVGRSDHRVHRRVNLRGRLDVDALHTQGCRQVDGARHEGHLRTGGPRRLGDRKAHLSGTAVADEAHRIERLPRGACGDHNMRPGERLHSFAARQHARRDVLRLEHSTGAILATRLLADGGTQHLHAARNERRDVRTSGGGGPHLLVHRRGDRDRCPRRKTRGGQEIVGEPMRKPRQKGGAGRRDEDEICPASELDMAHGRFRRSVPKRRPYGSAGECLEGERRDEFARPGRQNHLHVRTPHPQSSDEIRRLVGGNAAGHTEQDAARGRS
jgi:hypothetical protein